VFGLPLDPGLVGHDTEPTIEATLNRTHSPETKPGPPWPARTRQRQPPYRPAETMSHPNAKIDTIRQTVCLTRQKSRLMKDRG